MRKSLFILCLVLLCSFTFSVGTCYTGETKQFKFFDFGIYTVPEDFPDKFLNFRSRILAQADLVDDKVQMVMVEYTFGGSPGHLLIVRVVGYLTHDQKPVIVCIKTIVAIDGVGEDKWAVVDYVDMQMFATGKSSQILTKVDKSPDLQKFINERITALKKLEV